MDTSMIHISVHPVIQPILVKLVSLLVILSVNHVRLDYICYIQELVPIMYALLARTTPIPMIQINHAYIVLMNFVRLVLEMLTSAQIAWIIIT